MIYTRCGNEITRIYRRLKNGTYECVLRDPRNHEEWQDQVSYNDMVSDTHPSEIDEAIRAITKEPT